MTASVPGANEVFLASESTSPARARDFVERYLQSRELHYLVDDICLVVSELVTNAVVHARTPIRVRVEEMPFCVKLTVYDHAVDHQLPNLANLVGADDEGGRGLWIVDACSEDWGVDLSGDEEKSTWALFAVRPKSSWVGAT